MYGNPNARVPFTYKEFFNEAMAVIPSLRFIPQGQMPVHELCMDIAVESFLKQKPAPLTREVLTTFRKYGEVTFKP